MNKQANIQKAIVLMKSQGMSAEKALKTVYPDWDDAKIRKAAMTIRTMDKTAAVMQVSSAMAKLASGEEPAVEKKVTFSPAMDKSPHLKGKQSKLPDQIQAKILKDKLKKEKKASVGVSLTGLKYASNAMYASHIEKKAGLTKEAIRGILGPSVGQWTTRGASLGGLAGGGAEIMRLLRMTTPQGRAGVEAAEKALRQAGGSNAKRVMPWQKADAAKGEIGFASSGAKDAAFLKEFDKLQAAGGFGKNPMGYVKLFAPNVLKGAGAGAAAGGALGAGAGAIARNMAKKRMMETAKQVAVPAALGLGGLAVLS